MHLRSSLLRLPKTTSTLFVRRLPYYHCYQRSTVRLVHSSPASLLPRAKLTPRRRSDQLEEGEDYELNDTVHAEESEPVSASSEAVSDGRGLNQIMRNAAAHEQYDAAHQYASTPEELPPRDPAADAWFTDVDIDQPSSSSSTSSSKGALTTSDSGEYLPSEVDADDEKLLSTEWKPAPQMYIPKLSAEELLERANLLEALQQELHVAGATDIKVIDVQNTAQWTNHMIIAEMQGVRHVQTAAEDMRQFMKKRAKHLAGRANDVYIDGDSGQEWIAMDLGSVVLHLVTPAERQRLDLDNLWADSNEEVIDEDLAEPVDPKRAASV
ncbi:hypothetical protein GQ42DRAFT_160814 [Ramicandelaber brevisporus]|nr:hypothetical protein GQ42DRAFT_160814 [Ramicandelaber brevisporus]